MSAPMPPNPEPAVDPAAASPEPPAAADPAFTPLPPVLDERVDNPEADPQAVDAPAAPAAPAASPAQAGLDSLAAAVLDAAELANRGAAAATAVSTELHQAIEGLRENQARSQRHHLLLMIGIGVTVFLALVFFVVTGVRMNSRINQLDATLLAVAKRAVALNAGLESLESVNASVGQLAEQVTLVARNSSDVGARLEQAAKQSEALGSQISTRTAEQVAAGSQGLARQVEALNARLAAQAGSLQSVSRELQALKASVSQLDRLNRDVQALVALQREHNQQTAQKSSPAVVERERDRGVQYPRPQPPVSPNAGQPSAAPGGMIIVGPRAN